MKTWYANLPDPVKAGLATFTVAFFTILIPGLLGWLGELQSWLADLGSNAPEAQPFPDPDVLTKLLFSALAAGALGVVNWAFREAQRRFSWLPGSGPHYEDASGAIELRAAGARPALEAEPFPEPRHRAR